MSEFKDIVDEHYGWLDAEEKAAPMEMADDVLRFRANRVVRYLLDSARQNKVGLNELWAYALAAGVYREEMQEFYRLIGYSLSGYGEIDFECLPNRCRPLQNPENEEGPVA
jgi:hypothetical protein